MTHLPHDATAPQILGVHVAADAAGAKGQAPGAWTTRSVDIAMAGTTSRRRVLGPTPPRRARLTSGGDGERAAKGDIAKGATMETLFRHATGAAVPSSIRLVR